MTPDVQNRATQSCHEKGHKQKTGSWTVITIICEWVEAATKICNSEYAN